MSRIRKTGHEQWRDGELSPGDQPSFLYCLAEAGCEETGPCKVGVATSLSQRLSSLQGGNWRPIAYVWTIAIKGRRLALDAEQHVLGHLRPNPYSGVENDFMSEWVRQAPNEAKARAIDYLNLDRAPVVRMVG